MSFAAADLMQWGAALAFALMGMGALLRPEAVLAQFWIPSLTTAGRNEVRAVYGGFGLAVAAALVAASRSPTLRGGVVLTVAVALAGMASGRIISAVIDQRIDRMPLVYFFVEIVVAALLVASLN